MSKSQPLPFTPWDRAKKTGAPLLRVVEGYGIPVKTLAEERVKYQTYASRLMTPSVTNLRKMMNLLEKPQKRATGELTIARPALRGRGLKVPTYTNTILSLPEWQKNFGAPLRGATVDRFPHGAIIPWALNVRQREAATVAVRQFAERYPEQVIKFRNTSAMTEGALNPKALTDYYYKTLQAFVARESNIVNKGIQEKLEADVRTAMIEGDELVELAESLAERHLSLIGTIRADQFTDTFSSLAGQLTPRGATEIKDSVIKGAIQRSNNTYIKTLEPFTFNANASFEKFINDFELPVQFKEKFINKWKTELNSNIKPAMIGEKMEETVKMNALLGMQYTFTGELNNAWRNFQMVNGATVGHIVRDATAEHIINFLPFPNAPLAFVAGQKYGSEYAQQFQIMNNILYNKNIDVDDIYKILDTEGARFGGEVALNTLDTMRRVTTAGMLAGTIVPGDRYLAINILSAPLIVAATLGDKGMSIINPFRMYRRNRIAYGNADAISFIDKQGRSYTNGELRYLMGQHNRGMTEEMVHFANGRAEQILKATNHQLSGVKMGWAQWTWKQIDPRDYNAYSRFASWTDQQIRDLVFLKALEEGRTVNNAADMARRSLLDYGAIDPSAAKEINKYFNFFRFRMMMLAESLNGLGKAAVSGKPTMLTNTIKANMHMQNQAEAWLYSDDSLKSRLFFPFKEMFINDTKSYLVGPAHPTVEAYETMVSTLFQVGSLMAGETGLANFTEKLMGQQYRPGIQLLADFMTLDEKKLKRGYAPRLRDDVVPILKSNPKVWAWFKDRYLLETDVLGEGQDRRRLRADLPLYESKRMELGLAENDFVQYRFKDMKKWAEFKFWVLGATTIGIDRTIRDHSKAWMAAQSRKVKIQKGDAVVEETIYPYGRYSAPSALGYLLAIETSMPAYRREIDTARKLENILREYEDKEE